MSRVYRRYFEITDPAAIEFAREVGRRATALRKKADELANECGFERSAVRSDPHFGMSLAGFSCPTLNADTLKREWRIAGMSAEGNAVYVPRRSLKIGKQRAKQMAEVRGVSYWRDLKASVGLESFPDAYGAIGAAGWGVHYAHVAFVDGDDPALLASLPFERVDAEVPASLAGAAELTEHQYLARASQASVAR